MSNGKSSSEPKLTLMSIAAIVVNFAMQSRVNMDLDHVRRITEAILDGATFKNAPVDVFEIEPGVYWLAEGFHRTEGHKKAGKTAIWARVHQGTKSDAVAFAAGANLRNDALTVTNEDRFKAARMLLEDPEHFKKGDLLLSDLCGISPTKIKKTRLQYCLETGTPLPSEVETRSGAMVPYDKAKRRESRITSGNGLFRRAQVDGIRVRLGSSDENAKVKLDAMLQASNVRRAKLIHSNNFSGWLSRRSVLSKPRPSTTPLAGSFQGLILPGSLVRIEPRISPRSAAQAVGDLFFWREEVGDPSLRLVLICYPDGDDMQSLIEPARNFGVEILTPDQVVEQFAGKKFPDESESA
jgi:hypothetical protein